MKRLVRILILVAVFTLVGIGIQYLLRPSESERHAVEQLAGVHTFSYGPTGYAGSIPEREDAFFTILAGRHSTRLFCELFERGTPEAKLYALYGLHLSHGDFNGYAKRFAHETAKIEILEGCIGSRVGPEYALSDIQKGRIERYLSSRREMERARIAHKGKN